MQPDVVISCSAPFLRAEEKADQFDFEVAVKELSDKMQIVHPAVMGSLLHAYGIAVHRVARLLEQSDQAHPRCSRA